MNQNIINQIKHDLIHKGYVNASEYNQILSFSDFEDYNIEAMRQLRKEGYKTTYEIQELKNNLKSKRMAWTNNQNRNNNWNGNRNQNWNGNQRQQQGDTKKSGATYTKMKGGKYAGMYAVNAWRKTKAGLMVAKGFPVSDVEHKSDKGNFFLRYAVEVSMPSAGTSQTYWCLMNTKTQKLVIKELSLVISPNGQGYTATGKRVSGFFGANFKRR